MKARVYVPVLLGILCLVGSGGTYLLMDDTHGHESTSSEAFIVDCGYEKDDGSYNAVVQWKVCESVVSNFSVELNMTDYTCVDQICKTWRTVDVPSENGGNRGKGRGDKFLAQDVACEYMSDHVDDIEDKTCYTPVPTMRYIWFITTAVLIALFLYLEFLGCARYCFKGDSK